jgi:trk system potassium uptake protein TrkH
MQPLVILRILGLLMLLSSSTLVPPIVTALIYGDGALLPFVEAFGLTLVIGFLLFLPVRHHRNELRLRDGFLVVVLFWTVLESISGITTTGATVIVGIDALPHSLLLYRQELQWLGGMGIIVLAVAVLPMLGVGGMQLFRAETPGPVKDTKLTPRITETAKALWYIYLGLTVACCLAYWMAGMSFFDAMSHSFSTVAIGGFSTHDASIGYFNSTAIQFIAIVFMLLSGINFAIHFTAFRHRSLKPYQRDAEFRTYILVLCIVSIITVGYLQLTHFFDSTTESIIEGLFQVVSIGTTIYRRLFGLYRRRHQGDSNPVAGQAGRARTAAPGAPECAVCGQDRQEADAREGDRSGVGIFRRLFRDFGTDDPVADGNRARPGDRVFGGGGLPQ